MPRTDQMNDFWCEPVTVSQHQEGEGASSTFCSAAASSTFCSAAASSTFCSTESPSADD